MTARDMMAARVRAALGATAVLLAAVAVVLGGATPAGAAADWQPPPGATPSSLTYLYLASTSGDYIGQGKTYVYTPSDTDITVSATGGSVALTIAGFEDWRANFQLPSAKTKVETGFYDGLTRYPFNDKAVGGLSFSGEGRGCNELTGWIQVDRATYVGSALTQLTLRFAQHCEGGASVLHGQLVWDVNTPLDVPPNPTLPIPAGLWAPVNGAVPATGNFLHLASQAGDYIGGGQTHTYGDARGLSVVGNGSGLTFGIPYRSSDGEDWDGDLVGSNRADQLLPGYYQKLQRYPFHNPVVGGFDFSGDGRGCNKLTAWATIDELRISGGNVTDIALRFEQHCEGGTPALHGQLRWQDAVGAGTPAEPAAPTVEPNGLSATVRWVAPANGGSAITGYEVVPYANGLAQAPIAAAAGATSVQVPNLVEGTTYAFKVDAINAHGPGRLSRPSSQYKATAPHPTISSLAPSSGPRKGGAVVTISGIDLGGATAVTFGAVPATSFTQVSSTKVTAVAPALAIGTSNVRVVTPNGTTPTGASTIFTSTGNTPGAPTGVAGTAGNNQATVTWTAGDAGDSAVNGAVVNAYVDGSSAVAATASVVGTATTATVTGLAPGTSYRFRVAAKNSYGTGDLSGQSAIVTLPAPDITPFASIAALVTRQYLDFTGRSPSPAELTAGVSAITSGSQTPAQWVAAMRNRPEWTTFRSPVVRLYSAYFLRLPDASGLAYWAGRMQDGATVPEVSSSFAASSEFKKRYGNLTNAQFVKLVYLNVLGRQPDSAGLTFWVGQLGKGKTRGYVMSNFSESSENKRLMQATVDIVGLYTGMLRRTPTGDELAAGLTALASPDGAAVLAGQILHSAAYDARV